MTLDYYQAQKLRKFVKSIKSNESLHNEFVATGTHLSGQPVIVRFEEAPSGGRLAAGEACKDAQSGYPVAYLDPERFYGPHGLLMAFLHEVAHIKMHSLPVKPRRNTAMVSGGDSTFIYHNEKVNMNAEIEASTMAEKWLDWSTKYCKPFAEEMSSDPIKYLTVKLAALQQWQEGME
jgi:hypothetical protein